ncbi:MAG: DUF4430 domain-containing protein [Herbinix sp.]|nr:DUF4430 domain-containing protein [Herbinix sp.]
MKKITQKLAFLIFSATLLIAVSSISTAFAADKSMSITLRIEGIEDNLLNVTEDVPYTDSLTLKDALSYIDAQEDSIAITGVDVAYITDINGETAGKFGGWDGWLYKVNGVDASVGIDSLQLSDGDSVVLFYGDPFGVGMQFPVADTTDINDGVIRFTSSDTTYDADYNAITKVNPVVGATVTWSNGEVSTDYVTDDNGVIKIETEQLTSGSHILQIAKVGDAGIPLVLRFAPDFSVSVDAALEASLTDNAGKSTDNNESTATDTVNEIPKTGEKIAPTVIFLVMAVVSLTGVIFFRRKEAHEK